MRARSCTCIVVCNLAFDVIGIKSGEEDGIDVLPRGYEFLAYGI
jgi:hypothetical protein